MKSEIKKLCDSTIKNYKKVKEELRYDGEYINHFASLIYSNCDMELPTTKVKNIRKYIKDKTSRMSCFRGDILYILSLLIAQEVNFEYFVGELLDTYDLLLEAGFKESQYLVLTAYAITKHGKKMEKVKNVYETKNIYQIVKRKYSNLTNEEDYLECALLALSRVDADIIENDNEIIAKLNSELDMFSKNSIQGLTMAMALNEDDYSIRTIQELFKEFEEKDMKISHQFLPFLGSIVDFSDPKGYVGKVEQITEYLCLEEPLYEFYMDKSFRTFIAIVLLEFSKTSKKERYLNELLSICVYSFLISKNQGIFSEVLA